MSPSGEAELLVRARSVLLDALEALARHRESLVIVGAQAIYLHTGRVDLPLAEATKDSDVAIDPRELHDDPLLENAMRAAGFRRDLTKSQPGSWLSADGVPVDLMVPEALAGASSHRGARIPPHGKNVARNTRGLEAALVDHEHTEIRALDPGDARVVTAKVAGPAALLVSKLHKLGDRADQPGRLVDKDAHDIYRLLVAAETPALAGRLRELSDDELAGPVTVSAIVYLRELFAAPTALGAVMAGRAEQTAGDPEAATVAAVLLTGGLLAALDGSG